MGKLKNLKPVLGALPPRLGPAPGDVKAQDKQRYDRNALRRSMAPSDGLT
jgi:hypothetical protein